MIFIIPPFYAVTTDDETHLSIFRSHSRIQLKKVIDLSAKKVPKFKKEKYTHKTYIFMDVYIIVLCHSFLLKPSRDFLFRERQGQTCPYVVLLNSLPLFLSLFHPTQQQHRLWSSLSLLIVAVSSTPLLHQDFSSNPGEQAPHNRVLFSLESRNLWCSFQGMFTASVANQLQLFLFQWTLGELFLKPLRMDLLQSPLKWVFL